MAKNTVKIVNNYIEVRFVGDQSYDKVKEFIEEGRILVQQLIDKDEWVRIFVDLSELGKTNSGSMRASKEGFNYLAYDRMVIFGASRFMTTFVKGVILASGRQSSARVEGDKEKALEWLLQDPKQLKI